MSQGPDVNSRAAPSAGSAPFDALEPWDEHNQRLGANVHPQGWQNPEPAGRYGLVVVGAGTGGLVTAAIAVALGARVALIERKLMGGDCLNVGCVPSKGILRAARAWRAAREAERFGGPAAAGDGDFSVAMERMRRLRADISEHDSADRFRGLGADVYIGDARFTGDDRVEVGGATLRFRRAVIATGTSPQVPPIRGLESVGYRTNETIFSLTRCPDRLLVIGGGPIGCELAQAFAEFGAHVTLLEAADRILSTEDAEGAAVVARALERSGVEVVVGAKVESVEKGEGGRSIATARIAGDEQRVEFDELLLATGRAPNVEGLQLDRASVRFDGRQGVKVDDRLRTTNSRIFAIGDVVTDARFTHVADAHARLVVRNALFYGRGKATDLIIPHCTYTSPELAHVGISHEEAAGRAAEVDTVTVPYGSVDRAKLDGDDEGFLRVRLARGSDRILGATIVGRDAGELISQVTQAMTAGIGLGKLSETIFPYPTRAEILRKAADSWRRQRLTPLVGKAFELYFKAMR